MKLLLDDEFDRDKVLQIADRMKFDRQQSRVAIYLYNEKAFRNCSGSNFLLTICFVVWLPELLAGDLWDSFFR